MLCPHPAVADALAILREGSTPPGLFRTQLTRLAAVMVAQASSALPLSDATVRGPLETVTVGRAVPPVLVPILRAGAAMLEGALTVWPDAPVGFLGLARDEDTLAAQVYLDRLGQVEGHHVLILEPMLATGSSLVAALAKIMGRSTPPASVSVAGVVCAPQGVTAVNEAWPEVALHYAACDTGLDDRGFIRPGLGDAGDRAWGR